MALSVEETSNRILILMNLFRSTEEAKEEQLPYNLYRIFDFSFRLTLPFVVRENAPFYSFGKIGRFNNSQRDSSVMTPIVRVKLKEYLFKNRGIHSNRVKSTKLSLFFRKVRTTTSIADDAVRIS